MHIREIIDVIDRRAGAVDGRLTPGDYLLLDCGHWLTHAGARVPQTGDRLSCDRCAGLEDAMRRFLHSASMES